MSGVLPGSGHDLTRARIWGIIDELAAAGLIVLADKGYAGAGEPVLAPYRGLGNSPRPFMCFRPASSPDDEGSLTHSLAVQAGVGLVVAPVEPYEFPE